MNPFTLLLAAVASFFGAGHIPPSAAAKVALGCLLTLVGAVVLVLVLMRYGVDPATAMLLAFFSALGVFKSWAWKLGGDE